MEKRYSYEPISATGRRLFLYEATEKSQSKLHSTIPPEERNPPRVSYFGSTIDEMNGIARCRDEATGRKTSTIFAILDGYDQTAATDWSANAHHFNQMLQK